MSRKVQADPNSAFRINKLAPGHYYLDQWWTDQAGNEFRLTREFDLEMGKQRQVDLGSDLGPYSLSGEFANYKGGSRKSVAIRLVPEFSWDYTLFSLRAKTSAFRIGGLRLGRYRASILSQSETIEIKGDTRYDFVLPAAGQ